MANLLYQQGASQYRSEVFKSGENDLRSNYISTMTSSVLSSTSNYDLDRSAIEDDLTSTRYVRSDDEVDSKAWQV